jgi:malonyl-CoA/methylmalonyl-CoA synthetase
MSGVPIVARAENFADNLAVVDAAGEYRYRELLDASEAVASGLLDGRSDLNEARIAFLVPSGFEYVAIQWGIWRAGGIAVPLCVVHPLPEMQYVLDDTDAEKVIYHQSFAEKLGPLIQENPQRFSSCEEIRSADISPLPNVAESRRAMILYTSGSTGKPKGVVSTHANIASQITSLIDAWRWTSSDHILHVLPLHHTHGIINVLCCALWSGAACEMLEKFDATEVWRRFVERPLTLFMAVPTIYVRLINEWEKAASAQRQQYSDACRKMRLMVSGCALDLCARKYFPKECSILRSF